MGIFAIEYFSYNRCRVRESLKKGDYLLKENSKNVTIIKRDNLRVYLNHSDKKVKHEIKGKVILNNYRGLENGYLLPWQAIICEE